jgi:hypothetical protein
MPYTHTVHVVPSSPLKSARNRLFVQVIAVAALLGLAGLLTAAHTAVPETRAVSFRFLGVD